MRHEATADRPILVVEDNEVVRGWLADVLRREGYTVAPATNAKEALACLRAGLNPDLILLDMLTPIVDGWRFLEARRQDAALAGAPVVILTGISIASAEWAASLGADGYLHKPIGTEALLQEVRRCAQASKQACLS